MVYKKGVLLQEAFKCNNVYNPEDEGGRVDVCDHAFKHEKDEQVGGGLKVYTKIVSPARCPVLPRPLPCGCPTPAAQRLGESIKAVL